MFVTFNLGKETNATELNALAAFVAVMGGRVGNALPAMMDPSNGMFDDDGEQFISQEDLGFCETKPVTVMEQKIDVAGMALSDSVDVSGAVWNEELHAATKAKNADGTWRARRNVKATAPLASPVATESPAVVATIAAEPVAPPPPPAAPPPPPPIADAVDHLADFRRFVDQCNAASVPMTKVAAALGQVGLKQPQDLIAKHELLPSVRMLLELPA